MVSQNKMRLLPGRLSSFFRYMGPDLIAARPVISVCQLDLRPEAAVGRTHDTAAREQPLLLGISPAAVVRPRRLEVAVKALEDVTSGVRFVKVDCFGSRNLRLDVGLES